MKSSESIDRVRRSFEAVRFDLERDARKLLVVNRRLAYIAERESRRSNSGVCQMVVLCSQCDKPETQCTCEKYCCFCQSQQGIRLCVDGLYYCPDCREACDVRTADSDAH